MSMVQRGSGDKKKKNFSLRSNRGAEKNDWEEDRRWKVTNLVMTIRAHQSQGLNSKRGKYFTPAM